MYRYISVTIASVFYLIYVLYCIIHAREIKKADMELEKNILNRMIVPFYCISKKYNNLASKVLTNRIKISIKNLYQKNYKLEENRFLAVKLFSLFHILIICLIIFSIYKDYLISFISIIFLITFNSFLDSNILNLYKSKTLKFKSDLPSFITRLTLLINSGIRIRTAIEFISINTSGEVSLKMQSIKKMINNGYSEEEAYNSILMNTDDILIRKFISNILSNLKKGGDDIEKTLNLMKKESDEYKKSQIIIKTQEANRKLLFPNLMIFIGIMLMVMLPILFNLI